MFAQHRTRDEVISGQGGEMNHFAEVELPPERYLCVDRKRSSNTSEMAHELFANAMSAV